MNNRGFCHTEGIAPIPYVSLFSGAGGLDLGLEAVGFEARVCLDFDAHSCRTLRFNRTLGRGSGIHNFLHKAVVIEADVHRINADALRKASRLGNEDIPLLVGGPPCQSFSVFGQRRGMEDPRGTLLVEYVRLLQGLRPKAFLFENVEGLLTVDNGTTYSKFIKSLENHGGETEYKVSAYLLEAANYGVPQFRSRLFIFGSREGISVPKPEPTHYVDWNKLPSGAERWSDIPEHLLKCPVVADFLHGLPEPPSLASGFPNHVGRDHSTAIINRYRNLSFGERDPLTRINKLHPDRPSYTIIVGSDKGGGKGHVHPYYPREVTPRESARAQTFPDWWWFSGSSRHPIRQVGNAVPPVLGSFVGLHASRYLFGIEETVTYQDILSRLGLNYLQGSDSNFPEWLKDVFKALSREKEWKGALALWRAVERYVPSDPHRIDLPVSQEIVS